jgi:hypothetical protein
MFRDEGRLALKLRKLSSFSIVDDACAQGAITQNQSTA